jgi:PEP-CTERM motif
MGGIVDYSANPLSSFISFSLNDGDTYNFSLDQSIQTISYSFDGSNGTIGLYILGDLTSTGSTPYTDPSPTALTLTLNETGGSGYSISGTLANPPPGSGISVPEPASMTLLGGGLAALGMIRRRRAAKK